MSMSDITNFPDPILMPTASIDQRTITAVSHIADGRSVDVGDADGVRLAY